MASEVRRDRSKGHRRGHDCCEQGFGGQTSQTPEHGRSYAAERGETSGALVCGSSKRIIKR